MKQFKFEVRPTKVRIIHLCLMPYRGDYASYGGWILNGSAITNTSKQVAGTFTE